MLKKGIAIATDTIVYIILAVLVLTILLFFLTSQSGPAQTRVQLEVDRNTQCSTVLQYDTNCDGNLESGISSDKTYTSARDKLSVTCQKLTQPGCTGGSLTPECLQRCCLACPKKT